MSDTFESRLVKLEVTTENHAEDIKELRETSGALKDALQAIEKSLNQIKYLAVGALAVVVAQTIGIDKAVKIIMGS